MDLLQSRLLGPEALVQSLHKGAPAIIPTDTLPALTASPSHAHKLWELKNRPAKKPFILMGACPQDLFKSVLPLARVDAELMARKFWPGALTLVLPSSGDFLKSLNLVTDSLGMRVPDCEMTISMLKRSGPLATTSANLSGAPPSLSELEAARVFPSIPLLAPIPWPKASGLASTVLAWQSEGSWKVLRKGAVLPELL